jgi:hypothetical protein
MPDMPDTASDRIEGPVQLTLRLDELEAIKNPELIGRAEWFLRLMVDDREEWSNDEAIRVKAGDRAPIGVELPFELASDTNFVSVRVEATEKDRLKPDDHAESEAVRLYRSAGFNRSTGLALEALGKGAHIVVHISVDARAAE